MITPQLKDLILKDLIKTGTSLEVNLEDAYKDYNTSSEMLALILDQFEKKELIEQSKMLGGTVNVYLTADAFDFDSHGGFTGQEELLQVNIKKLLNEIEVLKKELAPGRLGTIEKLASIASAIAAALALFKK